MTIETWSWDWQTIGSGGDCGEQERPSPVT